MPKAITKKRAVNQEATDSTERAGFDKRTVGHERADVAERTVQIERFSPYEVERQRTLAVLQMYQGSQAMRIINGNQLSAAERQVDALMDDEVIINFRDKWREIEKQAEKQLKQYVLASKLGRWAISIRGINYIFAAGLLAHISFERAKTTGQVWQYAGQNPESKRHTPGKKSTFNSDLKKICWQIGKSFMLTHKHPDSFYGHLYHQRKLQEVERNESGQLAGEAARWLEKANHGGWALSKAHRATWESGKLQACGLDRRAQIYAVKIFLDHYFTVGREILTGEKVQPWIIALGGHSKYIPPPNWPMADEAEPDDAEKW